MEADANRLRQVLNNLVKNAQEACVRADKPLIKVTTHCLERGGVRFVDLSIEDNGPGFPAEVKDRLFEPYVTTKARGTGLGLAIVKKIIEEHGGMINAENVEPQGALIVIRLRLLDTGSEPVDREQHGIVRVPEP